MSAIDHLDALEKALVKKRFPPMSPWWRETFVRFYASGRRQLVIRKGRRAGGSSSLTRIAVLEGTFGQHEIPPGDVGVIAFISVSRDEASQRLRTIKAILDAVGASYRPIEFGIELNDRPIAFKVFTASIAGVSGFTCICAICDEVAKWRDSDSGSNPAVEVLASLRPTLATQPTAKIFLSSSPLGTEDAHAQAFDRGDDAFQLTAFATTWDANPTVTEEFTHGLEPDQRIWLREYAAEPQAGLLAALDSDDISRACGRAHGPATGLIGLADPSSGSKDRFTYATAGTSAGIVVLDGVHSIEAREFKNGLTMSQAVTRIARTWRAHGIRHGYADQRESASLKSLFAQNGITYHAIPWTSTSKPKAVEKLRRWLSDDTLALPVHAELKKELLAFEERVTATGQLTFSARRSGHDDFVSLLVTLAHGCDVSEADRKKGKVGALRIGDQAKREERRNVEAHAVMAIMGGGDMPVALAQKVLNGLSLDDAETHWRVRAAEGMQRRRESGVAAANDAAWEHLCKNGRVLR